MTENISPVLAPVPVEFAGDDALTGTGVFRSICDDADDGLFVVDAAGRCRYANAAACRQSGFTADELRGRAMSEIVPGLGTPAGVARMMDRIDERGRLAPFVTRERRQDGTTMLVEIAVSRPVIGGRPHLLVAVRDTAARQRAGDGFNACNHQPREGSDHRTHNVAVRSDMIQLLHDVTAHCHRAASLDETLAYILREFCRFDGWCFGHVYRPNPDRPDDLVAAKMCYEERPGRFRAYRAVTRGLRLRRGQGLPGRVWKRVAPEYLSGARLRREFHQRRGLSVDPGVQTAAAFPVQLNGEVLAVFEFFSDLRLEPNHRILEIMGTIGAQLALVEQRTRTEAALRKSEARLRRLVDSNIAGVFIADLDGAVREANPAFLNLLGFSRSDLTEGKLSWRRQTPPGFEGEIEEIVEALRIRHASEPREWQFLRKDGTRVPVLAGMAGLDRDHSVPLIAFVVDLSEIRRLQRQLLEVSDYEKQQLGQDLHDGLSQQISGIKFQMESLERALRESAHSHGGRAAELVTLLNQAETAAHELAHGLLPMPRGEAGLAAALEDLTVLMQQLYRRPCSFRMPKPVLVTDPHVAMHLYRIAQEAVGNALKHADPESVILSLTRKRHSILLQIHDDGRGIHRESYGQSKRMGLHIMRYRAGLIGAHLQIESRPGAGTAVTCLWEQPRSPEISPP